MNNNLKVELGQLWEEDIRPVFWIADEVHSENDALVFTNLNLLKAGKAIEEMGALETKNKFETICVGYEVDDRITPDILQKIILEEEQVDWPKEQIIHLLNIKKKGVATRESSCLSWSG